ncbi:MAG TPA: sulfite exporter TauE/SafE family protein [Pseudogracilibacillus sp.]|nr:sulfite exporter TauE/SafE family protein [Pseudogracilibacillus sp.]
MNIFITMVFMGIVLGFIGAGGSGFIIAILVTFFAIPVHTALGTSLLAMVFTALSGSVSHYKQQNLMLRIGIVSGIFGATGALIGSQISPAIPEERLAWLTASMLFLSAFLLALRLFTKVGTYWERKGAQKVPSGMTFWFTALGVGLFTGLLSGIFGIGASSFIQIGLLVFFGLTVQQAAGTTFLIILPLAFVGGFGYYAAGNLDIMLFVKVAFGTIIGAYIGAKFTNKIHPLILKTALVSTPMIGGILLIVGVGK